ncbi:MAG: GNAT family N-acetyltransferase [Actinomycetes bacterium]
MVRTERLELRPAEEQDRAVFVELFGRGDFMVFSGGPLTPTDASARFDEMLATGREIPFAKQPVVERASGLIVGYSGVAWFDFDGRPWLEFGYRFVPEARGKGYATEAAHALLAVARQTFTGDILATIDPTNDSSKRVARKLGFQYWKLATIDETEEEIYRLSVHGHAEGQPLVH